MTRSFKRRIGRLEAFVRPPKPPRSPLVMLVEPEPEPEPERELAPGERVIEDWFRESGPLIWARERVTTSAEEGGRRCPPGGYLPDVLESFHKRCPYRQTIGACRMCQGTPIAEAQDL